MANNARYINKIKKYIDDNSDEEYKIISFYEDKKYFAAEYVTNFPIDLPIIAIDKENGKIVKLRFTSKEDYDTIKKLKKVKS